MGLEALAIAAITTSVVGTGVSAYNQYQAGKAQNRIAQQNANNEEIEAAAAERDARIFANNQRAQGEKLLARQRALYAKSGVVMEGTPLLVQADTAAELEKEALEIERQGELTGYRRRAQARLDRMQGASAKRAGRYGAIGTILSGAGSAAGMGFKFGQTGVFGGGGKS